MKKKVFTKEFDRRLYQLRDAINYYEKTRNTTNILPFLARCLTMIWAKDPHKYI